MVVQHSMVGIREEKESVSTDEKLLVPSFLLGTDQNAEQIKDAETESKQQSIEKRR